MVELAFLELVVPTPTKLELEVVGPQTLGFLRTTERMTRKTVRGEAILVAVAQVWIDETRAPMG